jgi:hypothetical protein
MYIKHLSYIFSTGGVRPLHIFLAPILFCFAINIVHSMNSQKKPQRKTRLHHTKLVVEGTIYSEQTGCASFIYVVRRARCAWNSIQNLAFQGPTLWERARGEERSSSDTGICSPLSEWRGEPKAEWDWPNSSHLGLSVYQTI